MNGNTVGRQEFLRSGAILLGGMMIAACAVRAAMTGGGPAQEMIEHRCHRRLGLECDNHSPWVEKFNEDRSPDVVVTMQCFPGAGQLRSLDWT